MDDEHTPVERVAQRQVVVVPRGKVVSVAPIEDPCELSPAEPCKAKENRGVFLAVLIGPRRRSVESMPAGGAETERLHELL